MIRDDSKQVLLSVFGVALLIVAIVGISYAIFVFSAKSRVDNTVRSGGITFEYLEGDSVIDINDALPVSDEVGVKQTKSFDFQVSSAIRGNTTVFYEVRAKSLTVDNKIDNQYVKIYLEKKDGDDFSMVLSPTTFKENPNTSLTNISVDTNTMLLYSGRFSGKKATTTNYSDEFRLKMWLSDKYLIDDVSRSFKIKGTPCLCKYVEVLLLSSAFFVFRVIIMLD